ncbi:hypothetical protein MAMC_00698 [Methylacidimicrobium cyclopophantes]|uniref:Uncharacterized protein n=1 Tax=Methylacidimicrobium cyclopophantes TaxID=1041766 RepID=A0A5E6M8L1_9BACT|nr:hypothetical protein [Methylacidimicrobium cyclopophantes]VVM05587.1 hypothetical protein MAMC_00698 [Methylacidimicrobium cyclopophantes]
MGIGSLRDYYREPSVRRRIAEYCGGSPEDPEGFSCVYLVRYGIGEKGDPAVSEPHASVEKKRFAEILEAGGDILRSLWDRASLLGILDIEYVNRDYPAEIFFQPAEVFSRMEPLYRTIRRSFGAYGIEPLTILTGQGYHFVFRVGKDSPAFSLLAASGSASGRLIEWGNRFAERFGRSFSFPEAAAYETLGRLFEILLHRILREYDSAPLEGTARLPTVPTDVAVGRVSPNGHREAVSLDLSLFGDPLPRRATRCPFSVYQKHRVLWEKYGERAGRELPLPVLLPRCAKSLLQELLAARVDWNRAVVLAQESSVAIPDASPSILGWHKDYENSPLAQVHRRMEENPIRPRPSLGALPPCVLHCLREPNPHLLKPTNLQTLTRVLLACGWEPSEIAELVRTRYEEDYGWGDLWDKYEAATRARFYVRLFSGLVLTGTDREIDLNCISHQEKGYCWQPFCGFNLADYRGKGTNGTRALDGGALL